MQDSQVLGFLAYLQPIVLSAQKLLKNCCERRETQARGGEKPECTWST